MIGFWNSDFGKSPIKQMKPVNPDSVFEALKRWRPKKEDRRKRRRTVAEMAILNAGRERAVKRRRAEAIKRAELRQKEDKAGRSQRRPYGDRLQDIFLLAMQPGQWHTAGDIVRACGFTRQNARSKLYQEMTAAGYVERTRDESTCPTCGHYSGETLWRLTSRGELAREAVLLLQ